ncbi:ATP-binding protein [Streptomyces sp. B-S-A8]|uniref:ATP-binding protein n=1 Tax=Streptomyces solicavernae TaxID=3043614 RepID=A0ABT6S3E9_9ACTN|nr:ATP-binding protein [Streptomyces sp. B-S-A8]MDI3390431.1 ATP-binding protein [Streptomyces sp. B-S-A8]
MTNVTAPWAYTLQLPHDPRAPGVARTTLRAVLDSHGMAELTHSAELLASELVTNAYLHSLGTYTLRLREMAPGRLRVSVWDTNPEIPAPFRDQRAPAAVPATDETGRGLFLIGACAERWGAYELGDGMGGGAGKLLWAECGRPG